MFSWENPYTVEFPLSFWLPKGSDEAFRFFQPQIWPLATFYSQEIDGFAGISPATRGIGVNLSGICVELTWLDQQDFPGFFCTEVSMVSINRYQQLWKHLTVSSKIPAVGQVKNVLDIVYGRCENINWGVHSCFRPIDSHKVDDHFSIIRHQK